MVYIAIWTQMNVSNKILRACFLLVRDTGAKLYGISEGLNRNSNYPTILRWNMVLACSSSNSSLCLQPQTGGCCHRQRNFDWIAGFLDYRESTQSLLKTHESFLVSSTPEVCSCVCSLFCSGVFTSWVLRVSSPNKNLQNYNIKYLHKSRN